MDVDGFPRHPDPFGSTVHMYVDLGRVQNHLVGATLGLQIDGSELFPSRGSRGPGRRISRIWVLSGRRHLALEPISNLIVLAGMGGGPFGAGAVLRFVEKYPYVRRVGHDQLSLVDQKAADEVVPTAQREARVVAAIFQGSRCGIPTVRSCRAFVFCLAAAEVVFDVGFPRSRLNMSRTSRQLDVFSGEVGPAGSIAGRLRVPPSVTSLVAVGCRQSLRFPGAVADVAADDGAGAVLGRPLPLVPRSGFDVEGPSHVDVDLVLPDQLSLSAKTFSPWGRESG